MTRARKTIKPGKATTKNMSKSPSKSAPGKVSSKSALRRSGSHAVIAKRTINVVLNPKAGGSNLLPQKPDNIPEDQWNLPAGFKPDGSFATLAEVVAKPVPTFSLTAVSKEQKKQLVVERLKRQPNFPTRFMLGVGKVDKDQAVTEVQNQTAAGKIIEEAEQMVINILTERAKSKK